MTRSLTAVVCMLILTAGAALAAQYEGDADGPWIYMDTIDISTSLEGDYLDYLGKGYVAVLDKVKAEGIILDYGVMVKITGDAGDGDVAIWWATNTLADIEKVFDRLAGLAAEMYSDTELVELMTKMEKIRSPHSTNIYRAVTWTAKE